MNRRTPTPIIPSLVPETSDLTLDRLLSPARHFRHPDDVLADESLDLQEKRAILSSWASDACAVESMPALRQPPGGSEPVSFDQIMDALRRLDEESRPDGHTHREGGNCRPRNSNLVQLEERPVGLDDRVVHTSHDLLFAIRVGRHQ